MTDEVEIPYEPDRQAYDTDAEDDGPEGADEGVLNLASKDRKVSPDKNDRSLSELHNWLKRGRLVVDPEWQREYVWDTKRASKLVESFLIDLPIPVIYLALNAEGKYEVIDGLQRLTSMFRFFDNEFALRSLEIRPELNGRRFESLDSDLQFKLEAATLRTFELPRDTDKDLMFLIFERLNTAGVTLTDMEIRNCLYRGTLNALIKELAKDDNFKLAANQKNLNRRMTDRSLVLRFLAFYQMTHTKAKKGLKTFLNEFLETYRNPPPNKLREFEDVYRKAMRICVTVFGQHAFRIRRKHGASSIEEWTPRLNASIFQVIGVSFTAYEVGALTRASDAIYEEYLDLISTDERWIESVSLSTGDPQKIEYAFDTWNTRLKRLMSSYQGNDPQRVFTREQKKQLWESDKACAICGNEIRSIDDAHVDHIIQHWKGGQTIPENARLAHRTCNMSRARQD